MKQLLLALFPSAGAQPTCAPAGLRTSLLLATLCALTLTGCPTRDASGGPTDECQEIGEQCRLAPGKLGVCTMNQDEELECMSQH